LVTNAQNRVLGAEALRLVLAYAFGPLHLHRVPLDVFAFNTRAIRAYEKGGFQHEGRMRDALWWDGTPHDALLMAVLATECDNSPGGAQRSSGAGYILSRTHGHRAARSGIRIAPASGRPDHGLPVAADL
jgi:hypothetical protein